MKIASFRVKLTLVLGLSGALSGFPLLAQQPAEAECQCRAPGGAMRDLGTVECVHIGGKAKLVTCTMSTNTPYWKDVEDGDGCPSA